MSVIVFLHAHPDDESSQTAGTMARAAAAGHRVVEVFATNGDYGTPPEAPVTPARPVITVAEHRRDEATRSAAVLGIARVEWLGHHDSGMTGWPQNELPGAFCAADVDQAAGALAAILDEEDADVLVTYDWHGGYGHPDHIQAHRVAHRAAALAARTPRVLEGSADRDAMRRSREEAAARGEDQDAFMDPDFGGDDGNGFGTPEAELHWVVRLTPQELELKRSAMECHGSQADVQHMLAMPRSAWDAFFGAECYREPGLPPQPLSEDLRF